MRISSLICCGIKEITGFTQYRSGHQALIEICKKKYRPQYSQQQHLTTLKMTTDIGNTFFLYSLTKNQGFHKGELLARIIKRHKLGTVVESPEAKNPNSQNYIKVWLWRINQKNLKSWYLKQYKQLLQPNNFNVKTTTSKAL